jgi:Acyl-CoA dehydrogenase, C-terminal domain
MSQLAWERLGIACNAITAMERAVELTSAYVKERMAFGQPLLSHQNTQFKLAEAKTHAVVARTFVDDLVIKLLDGEHRVDEACGLISQTRGNFTGSMYMSVRHIDSARFMPIALTLMRALGYSYHAEKPFQYQGKVVKVQYVEHVPPDDRLRPAGADDRRHREKSWPEARAVVGRLRLLLGLRESSFDHFICADHGWQ